MQFLSFARTYLKYNLLPESQASENMPREVDEPDSQVVKYAYPLEREAQDLLFSLAEVNSVK